MRLHILSAPERTGERSQEGEGKKGRQDGANTPWGQAAGYMVFKKLIRHTEPAVGLMVFEKFIRYASLAVGLKPSATGCEARLRGLYRIMYSKTISPRLCEAKSACAAYNRFNS